MIGLIDVKIIKTISFLKGPQSLAGEIVIRSCAFGQRIGRNMEICEYY